MNTLNVLKEHKNICEKVKEEKTENYVLEKNDLKLAIFITGGYYRNTLKKEQYCVCYHLSSVIIYSMNFNLEQSRIIPLSASLLWLHLTPRQFSCDCGNLATFVIVVQEQSFGHTSKS